VLGAGGKLVGRRCRCKGSESEIVRYLRREALSRSASDRNTVGAARRDRSSGSSGTWVRGRTTGRIVGGTGMVFCRLDITSLIVHWSWRAERG
jgi:hypothetical protein